MNHLGIANGRAQLTDSAGDSGRAVVVKPAERVRVVLADDDVLLREGLIVGEHDPDQIRRHHRRSL